jgi:hypothetical protein
MVHWWVLGHSGPRITYAPKTWFPCELQSTMESSSHALKGFASWGMNPKMHPQPLIYMKEKQMNHSHVSCRSNGSYHSLTLGQ